MSETGPEGKEGRYVQLSLRAFRRVMALAWPYRRRLMVGCLLTLLSTGCTLALPLFIRKSLDGMIKTGKFLMLDRLAVGMVVLILAGAVIGFAQNMLMAYTGHQVVLEMRRKLFAHLQRLPITFFDQTRSGDLASRLSNDVGMLQQVLTDDVVRLVGNVATLIGGIAVLFRIEWRMATLVVGLLSINLFLYAGMGLPMRRLVRQALKALSDAIGAMTEVLANIRLTKAFAREPYEDTRIAGQLRELFQVSVKTSIYEGAFGAIVNSWFLLVMVGVLYYGVHNLMHGRLSAGSLLAFVITTFTVAGPMASLANLFAHVNRAVGASDRLFDILDTAWEPPDMPGALAFPQGRGSIRFEAVYFAYTPEVPVLTDLSLEFPAGKVTALVGPSGAGKTTLGSLLYRFYTPQSGSILIDGVPIDQIQRDGLRTHIGLVPQEPILFSGTIRENIRYGQIDATDAAIEAVACAANVAEFVDRLPKGYETLVGERGITLSGGQRQRVAIARAMLKDPRILILDEATSALDTRSEALVQEALERLMRGRTSIVIAHRLTTIQAADQIVVLESGQVQECGTHAELLALSGRYFALHQRQPIDVSD